MDCKTKNLEEEGKLHLHISSEYSARKDPLVPSPQRFALKFRELFDFKWIGNGPINESEIDRLPANQGITDLNTSAVEEIPDLSENEQVNKIMEVNERVKGLNHG